MFFEKSFIDKLCTFVFMRLKKLIGVFQRIVLVTSLTVLLLSCKQNKIIISGVIENCNSPYVVLMQVFPDEAVVIDTVLLIKGKFSHRIESDQVGVYLLKLSDDSFMSFIANPEDKLVFSGDATDLTQTYTIQGNEETKLLIESRRKLDHLYQQTELLSKEFVRYTYSDNFDSIKTVLDSSYNILFNDYKNYLTHFILSNPNRLASLMAFYQTLGNNSFFSIKEDRELLDTMYPALLKEYPNSIYVNDLKEKLMESDD